MPYPNYHSARINNPEKYERFATVTNENENYSWLPDGVIIILGITSDGQVEFQSIRFNKEKFTPEEAQQFLAEHNIEYLEFEEATSDEKTAYSIIYNYGGNVKIKNNGRLGGYLVVFSDENNPDFDGDFFTRDTDFGFDDELKSPVFFHHCFPVETEYGIKSIPYQIGEVTLKKTDVGIEVVDGVLYDWIEMMKKETDNYVEKFLNTIRKALQKGLLGWSSGTAGYLVIREQVKDGVYKIKRWLLGLDASLTPAPAGAMQGTWASMKTNQHIIDIRELEKSLVEGNSQDVSLPNSNDDKSTTNINLKGVISMDNFNFEEFVNKVTEKVTEKVVEAMKQEQQKVNFNLKTKLGDNEVKAFDYWLRTGDESAIKAEVPFIEGDTEQGGVLVPTEVYNKIVAKRDEISFARAAGATVITCGSKSITIPVENAIETPAPTSEGASYDDNESDPFAQVSVTLGKHTKLIKISEELLEDSQVNLVDFLSTRFGSKIGYLENSLATTALLAGTNLYTMAATNAISAADVNGIYHKLSKEYRDKAIWVVTKETEGVIRSISGNPYLFANTPNPIFGNNVYNTASMPAIAADAKSVVFGNPEYLAIVERRAMTIKRLDERFADTGYIGFLVSVRLAFALLQNEAFVIGKHPAS